MPAFAAETPTQMCPRASRPSAPQMLVALSKDGSCSSRTRGARNGSVGGRRKTLPVSSS